MKGISLILALFIFSTSLKASAFVGGLSNASNGESSSYSCCKKSDDSAIKDCSDSEEEQQESDCCDGDNCKCTCCLHIVFLQQLLSHSFSLDDFSGVNFDYSFLYQADYLSAVFHPPSLL